MAPATEPHHHNQTFNNPITTFIQSTSSNISSLFSHKPKTSPSLHIISTTHGSPSTVFLPLPLPLSESTQHDSSPSPSPTLRSRPLEPGSSFPSMVRIGGLKSAGNGVGNGNGGPAFVGQVFSMCDLTGTGLMAVSTHFDIPFISKRTPEWIKKLFSSVIKNESGPIFRFFMDLGDAVSYVKRLNIPSGVVGACRLDLAYEHFKEKPHLFQFVPNSKQVKAASKLLKGNRKTGGDRFDGVPVFSAQNLDIAIATPEGIKWYTPYFFDKNILDNILEESVDQHFQSLIQSRHVQRRRDVTDDNFAAEMIEETIDSIWEPTEVQDLMDEMGQPGIPLSVISKAAEMQLLYAVDKTLLGNRWLRKATGIQPKFPYMVDSFERRSSISRTRAFELATCSANSDMESLNELSEQSASAKLGPENKDQDALLQQTDLGSSRRDWLRSPWSKSLCEPNKEADSRFIDSSGGDMKEELQSSPLLPRITMVGIATTEPGQMSKSSVKKTMEDLSKELEQEGHGNSASKNSQKYCNEDRDPLFVANVGDYYSNMGKTSSPRGLRGVHR
ncbi:uncharacterized protein LOC104888360 isoform X1 [Beta vulgaris subsp. vulgaris]|uniref:uncharacterized protein LOC104888360 isoform X1 n=1 Tax=Beta vulgaris subsp. vulgaris TaxID=3555 RepID=UPI0020366933|nr:uncharacterized protein LOC104888360 isoform X1 [Beta vulgaris subsp. vulgaris]